jgi:hypothetical protein
MIQATVPSGRGLLFTSCQFDTPLLIFDLAATAAIGYLLALLCSASASRAGAPSRDCLGISRARPRGRSSPLPRPMPRIISATSYRAWVAEATWGDLRRPRRPRVSLDHPLLAAQLAAACGVDRRRSR